MCIRRNPEVPVVRVRIPWTRPCRVTTTVERREEQPGDAERITVTHDDVVHVHLGVIVDPELDPAWFVRRRVEIYLLSEFEPSSSFEPE